MAKVFKVTVESFDWAAREPTEYEVYSWLRMGRNCDSALNPYAIKKFEVVEESES